MRVLSGLLLLMPTLAWGQSATSPLTGTETFTCNQSGAARSCTVSQVFDAMQASQVGQHCAVAISQQIARLLLPHTALLEILQVI